MNTQPVEQGKIVAFPVQKKFTPPTCEEISLHCEKIGLPQAEGEKFLAYFESCGWVIGRSRKPMVSWRGAMATWKLNWQERQPHNKVVQLPAWQRLKAAQDLLAKLPKVYAPNPMGYEGYSKSQRYQKDFAVFLAKKAETNLEKTRLQNLIASIQKEMTL